MAEQKASKKKKSGQASDASVFVRNLGKLQSELRIILYMPKDMSDLYEKPLIDRLRHTGITLKTATPDKLPDEIGSYDRILAYQCPLPAVVAENEAEETEAERKKKGDLNLFDIKGAPSEALMTPFARKPGFLTDLEFRYCQLKEQIDEQEASEHFRNLAQIQQNIRLKLLAVQQKQGEVDALLSRLENLDEGYHLVLGFYLQQAIDNVLQLVTLGDVMKKYVKVLIVDDLGDRTLERLEIQGFRRRFLSTMSQQAFNQTYEEFKELYREQFPDATVSYQDFFSKCTVFDDYEIVAFNQWNTDKGGMPVLIRLKKNPELSQKDVRKLHENPSKVAETVKRLNREHQKLQDQLKEVELELHTAEAKGGVSESTYVGLNKKRKRILRSIKNVKSELNEIQAEVDVKPELKLYVRDFMATMQNKALVKEIMSSKAAMHAEPGVLKAGDLQQLSELIRQKKKKVQMVSQLNAQVKGMLQKMNEYAARFPLDPEKSYQQVLGIHTVNTLEMRVLGCGIAKSNQLLQTYPGPYFECRDGKSGIDWNDKRLGQVSVHIASKHIKINTGLLKRFFRVSSGDMTGRIENSPALPRSSDFENSKYGLFVINFNSYPISEIIDSLKMRNRSDRPFVPILLIDPLDKLESGPEKVKLELLLGLKKDGADTIGLQPPTYRIASLEDPESLNFVLCEIMGIDITTLSSESDAADAFDMDINGDGFMDQTPGMQVAEETDLMDASSETDDDEEAAEDGDVAETARKPATEAEAAPVSRRKDDRIKLYLRSEKEEEIFSLGALFSFDDDAGPSKQQQQAPPPPEPEPETNRPATDEATAEAGNPSEPPPRRGDQPLPPVRQKTNPKNPFQF